MAHRGPRGSFWSDAVEWESSFDEAMVPPRARAAFAPKGGSWEDALRESVNSARDDAADAGFGWEDQLAVDANAMVMRPSKFDAALGAASAAGTTPAAPSPSRRSSRARIRRFIRVARPRPRPRRRPAQA